MLLISLWYLSDFLVVLGLQTLSRRKFDISCFTNLTSPVLPGLKSPEHVACALWESILKAIFVPLFMFDHKTELCLRCYRYSHLTKH